MFRRKVLPPSLGPKTKPGKQPARRKQKVDHENGGRVDFLTGFLLALLFDPEDGVNYFIRNISEHLPDYMASHLKIFGAPDEWNLESCMCANFRITPSRRVNS
jgi:hypothetical protein